jgi:hypothetical protein
MKLYRLSKDVVIDDGTGARLYDGEWDELINRDDLSQFLTELTSSEKPDVAPPDWMQRIVAPLVSQEVWAAGVTYYRSRTARMAESQDAGGDSFYDRVLPATWKNVDAAKALIDFSRSHASPNLLGFMFTTWGVNKDVLLDFPPLVEGLKSLQN